MPAAGRPSAENDWSLGRAYVEGRVDLGQLLRPHDQSKIATWVLPALGCRSRVMNLVVWLPGLFVLGVVSMLACMAFAEGCGRI